MLSVCFYFQVHQPRRLRSYSLFDVGGSTAYFDEALDLEILNRVSEKCYLPMNALLQDLIEQHRGQFKVAFSISGSALEQMKRERPDVLDSFRRLAGTGCVEFLAETYDHSLAFVFHREEFDTQVRRHSEAVEKYLGVRPTVFRNTELIFNDHLAAHVAEMGYKTVLMEGADRVLGWRSPNYIYGSNTNPDLKLLLKNYRLSDDIAFRFGNRDWDEYPLTAKKFAGWVNQVHGSGVAVNLFMDYETFGEHQWPETGIFEFMRHLPAEILAHGDTVFRTPSETAAASEPVGTLDVPDFVSWADVERDLTAWLGNSMQTTASEALYQLREPVYGSGDKGLISDWRALTTSDHFYYMCTKWFADGDVHKYFNPFESPYEAYLAFMNTLEDIRLRLGNRVAGPEQLQTASRS